VKIGAADVDRDIARFNEAVEPMELMPTRTPDEARARGRYVLENDERVDVLVARSVPTTDGLRVSHPTDCRDD
jgi:hypothetical protein